MDGIPASVLSERLQEHLKGRRLRTAVFTAFQFDPGFFEQEILPALFDEPLHHAMPIRLVQLEDILKTLAGGISVYYDAGGLAIGDSGSGKLDVRRIPVRHSKGVFHPKNAFLLLESVEPDEEGYHPRTLAVASLSANLTRSGWWENVEIGHIEEVAEGAKNCLKEDLLTFLASVRRSVGARAEHIDLDEIVRFLRGLEQRQQKSLDGRTLPHFYSGREDFSDFLEAVAGDSIRGCHLEVISPYFDDAPVSEPLETLVARFRPMSIRLFLPRSDAGDILCREDLFRSLSAISGLEWGSVPGELLGMGRGEGVRRRFVHAKVYRFFTKNPAREICFVGSVNLTRSAHHRGNVESGFLIEAEPTRRPEHWLLPETLSKENFLAMPNQDEPLEGESVCPLDIRFYWKRGTAEAYWDAAAVSPRMQLQSRGIPLGTLESIEPRTWTLLSADLTAGLKESLPESSLVDVIRQGGPPARVLIQEEGMSHKPSILRTLSVAEILRYWALLTPAQRAAFIADHAADLAKTGLGTHLVVPLAKLIDNDTVFDRFAGIFHAFGCLERSAIDALEMGQSKVADYRIFGMKYDSLGSLLERLGVETGRGETSVESYVTLLCARQLCEGLREQFPDYWSEHEDDTRRLEAQLGVIGTLRQRLVDAGPPDLPRFLDWFDRWFLRRAIGPASEVT